MQKAQELAEQHMLGPHTEYRVVRCGVDDQRPWLSRAPVCEQLAAHRMLHVGEMAAQWPMAIVRPQPSGTYFMTCFGGKGEVLVDGDWEEVGPGTACLLPPRYPNAIRARQGEIWRFWWVRYYEPEKLVPVALVMRPEIRPAAPIEGFGHAVAGLLAACGEKAHAGLRHHWVELIHGYVQAFAGPVLCDERIRVAWERVSQNLKVSWDLNSVAAEANMSGESFRRSCHRDYGRSPMKQLTFMRIQRAMDLLHRSNLTVEAVGGEVGYQSVAAFSRTFHRWTGVPPSSLRAPESAGVAPSQLGN